MKIAILGREPEGRFLEAAATLLEAARKRGANLYYSSDFQEAFSRAGAVLPPGEVFVPAQGLPAGTDCLLTLGGDGTFLSSLVCVRDSGVPVAGINFGRLGFLAAAEAGSGSGAIDALFTGRYTVRERALLQVSSTSLPLPEEFYPYALNEIAFTGARRGMVSVSLRIDGRQLPPFWADGLLIATPTGSTAYSLSLGGPIVLPDSQVALLTPIASHNLNVRPMVVPIGASIEVRVSAERGGVVLSADDRTALFPAGLSATVTRGGFPLRYIAFSDNDFIDALHTKLHWGEDGRKTDTL